MGSSTFWQWRALSKMERWYIIVIKEESRKEHGMLQEEAVPCAKCKEGLHLSCLKPIIVPTIPSTGRVLTFVESRTFTCCDRQDFWVRAVFSDNEEIKEWEHPPRVPIHE